MALEGKTTAGVSSIPEDVSLAGDLSEQTAIVSGKYGILSFSSVGYYLRPLTD
jgi:hypothetical protein